MKKIIIPMNFTEVSANAFRYANALFPNAELHIVHAYSGIVNTREPVYLKAGQTKKTVLQEELTKQVLREIGAEKLPSRIHVEILHGETVASIRHYVRDNNIEQMVIGTRDKYDLFDRWVGTVTLGLVKTLNIPIYLIPRYAKYNYFDKVMVASDYHLKDKAFIKLLNNWNRTYRAFIKFLHIQSSSNTSFEEEKEAISDTLLDGDLVDFGFEIESTKNKAVSDSLLANAYTFGADLLISIPDNQSFLESLLFQSVSKELILKSSIPLLFLPNSKQVEDASSHIYPAMKAKYPNLIM